MKKILLLFVVCIMLAGCAGGIDEGPAPTLSPQITHPEGAWYDTNPPMAEGLVKKVTDDTIVLSVKDEDVELKLSKRAKEEIEIFAKKYDKFVRVGSFLNIKYEEEDGGLTALHIAFTTAN